MLDHFTINSQAHIVFELLQSNLLEVIEANPLGIEMDVIKKYAYTLIKALAVLHSKGIIHRDIKPENIMIGTDGVKLIDLGRAVKVPTLASKVSETYVCTRWYRAPEMMVEGMGYGS